MGPARIEATRKRNQTGWPFRRGIHIGGSHSVPPLRPLCATTMKTAYAIVMVLFIMIFFTGCSTPVDELAYRGLVPENHSFNEAIIRSYCDRLSQRIGYGQPEAGHLANDQDYRFHIHGEEITIGIVAYSDSRYIYARIFRKGYRTDEAKRVLEVAQELFAEMFPPAKMERHIRMQGFPGV